MDATIVPLLGKDGLPEQYIGIRTNITARKAVEAQLAEARTLSKFCWKLPQPPFT